MTISGTAIQLLSSQVLPNLEPTPATNVRGLRLEMSNLRHPNEAAIYVVNASAGATDSTTIRLWVRSTVTGSPVWFPHGKADSSVTNVTKGIINGGVAVSVNGALLNSASHTEIITDLRNYDAIYAEVLTGSVGTWNVFLQTRDPGNRGPGLVN